MRFAIANYYNMPQIGNDIHVAWESEVNHNRNNTNAK